MKQNKRIFIMIGILTAVVLLISATSYALFTYDITKDTDFKIAVGDLELVINDAKDQNKFIINNMLPTEDEEALKQDGYLFTITNNGKVDSYYTVYLDDITVDNGLQKIQDSYVKYNLLDHNTNYNYTSKLSSFSSNGRVLTTGILKAGSSITYTLKLWVDYEAGNDAQNTYFATQVRVVGTQANALGYQEDILNGADPVLTDNLVPIRIADDGTVTKADISKEWYSYENKEWANAIVLKEAKTYKNGEIIPTSNIDGYFVWIPRYKYEIFDEGNYNSATTVDSAPTTSAAQEINIVFESKPTTTSTGTTEGTYLTHPAFTTLNVNGIWVAKFEPSGSPSDIDILPNVESLRNMNVKAMFESAYNYNRSLDSHMMKNTEWGAVAYLSHSKYGRCTDGECEEIRINNASTFTTGCSANIDNSNSFAGCENAYNTSIGYLASTTGNITGIYDMSGSAWEYMASYINGVYGDSRFDKTSIAVYDDKYFDIYPNTSTGKSYNNRILGDATGEMGSFYAYNNVDSYSKYRSTWYNDSALFVDSSYPWFVRSGRHYDGLVTGMFYFNRGTGVSYNSGSFRLVLAP